MELMRVLCGMVLCCSIETSFVLAGSPRAIQEHGKAMVKDAEEMVMHGGMGDGKAILHHCSEVARHAEAILKLLPPLDDHGREAEPLLKEAIAHCKRVADMATRSIPEPA